MKSTNDLSKRIKVDGITHKETKLTGGRSTEDVVRVVDTVRRPHKTESDFTNSFLKYLESKGYPYAQRYLGRDEFGRDVFSYIEGFVPDDIGYTTIEQLCQFMKIIKQFHDASVEFTSVSDAVICHNDLSPCNTVFDGEQPIAIIDWDSARIGERYEDLTYILWLWINIGSHDRKNIDNLGQMKTALDAYGANSETLQDFADKLIMRMDRVIAEMSPDNYQYEKTKEWVNFSKLWVEQNRERITKEIG